MNMEHQKALIIIFTGSSGSGRKTIAHRVGQELNLRHIKSYTTRSPRSHDVHQNDYHYIDISAFQEAERNNEFLQTAEIDNQFYGVKKKDVEEVFSTHRRPVYLILNGHGAQQVKNTFGDQAIRIFLYVNKQILLARLEAKRLPYDVIDNYLQHYAEEVSYRKECEYMLENNEFSETALKVKTILQKVLTP